MKEIISHDVGIDIDNYLPADTTTTTIATNATKTTSSVESIVVAEPINTAASSNTAEPNK
jgi:hypothetical protein